MYLDIFYWELNAEESLHYYTIKSYQSIVDSSLANPKKQLSLFFLRFNRVLKVGKLGYAHTLTIEMCGKIRDFNTIGNVHSLAISYCSKMTDVNTLGNVNDLYIDDCPGISDVML